MGLPRPELAGRETGRGIYRGRLGIVGTGRSGDGKRKTLQKKGHARWEVESHTWSERGAHKDRGRGGEGCKAGERGAHNAGQ